ncbi:hypothetical protein NE237_007411 [Protea cynaroides]|uniref:Uncharacterized protein n=1 Tax=Protea cynaroides TaxID=273540 RepID=A0A9Q0KPC4_9MAGN|nr:hypothetical protein NE237_007411 [Protea cynaroides]
MPIAHGNQSSVLSVGYERGNGVSPSHVPLPSFLLPGDVSRVPTGEVPRVSAGQTLMNLQPILAAICGQSRMPSGDASRMSLPTPNSINPARAPDERIPSQSAPSLNFFAGISVPVIAPLPLFNGSRGTSSNVIPATSSLQLEINAATNEIIGAAVGAVSHALVDNIPHCIDLLGHSQESCKSHVEQHNRSNDSGNPNSDPKEPVSSSGPSSVSEPVGVSAPLPCASVGITIFSRVPDSIIPRQGVLLDHAVSISRENFASPIPLVPQNQSWADMAENEDDSDADTRIDEDGVRDDDVEGSILVSYA